MLQPPSDIRLRVRLDFWKHWLSRESPFENARKERLQGNRPAAGWMLDGLPRNAHSLRVLDLYAGPLTALGTATDRCQIDLIPIDPLAYHFDDLLKASGMTPPVRTQFCNIADVPATFGPKAFDIIYSYNGLDFTLDPIAHYKSLLKCLKPHGKLVTFQDADVPDNRIHSDGYRFFHVLKNGRICLRQRNFQRDLEDCLPRSDIRWSRDNGLIRIEISAKKRPMKVSLPERWKDKGTLPRLISMHIPKTAGTSFRRFLDSLYGERLRSLYADEETHPRQIPSVKLAPETQCLHGHFPADAYDQLFPGAYRLTWMRHPVERIASSFYQFHRHPETEDTSTFNKGVYSEGWSLMQFARKEELRRQLFWYFSAVPLDSFFFIGISERYEESLKLLCHLLNRPLPDSIDQVNTNPLLDQDHGYYLTKAQRLELEACYAGEIELYQQINYRLDKQLELAFG